MPTQRAANQRTAVYVLLTLVICFLFWRDEQNDSKTEGLVRDLQKVVTDIEAESARTDLAFCYTHNASRRTGNERAQAIRDAVDLAFADQPELQKKILDEIPPDQPELDCTGIGNRKEDFSKQPAINGFPPATTTTRSPQGQMDDQPEGSAPAS